MKKNTIWILTCLLFSLSFFCHSCKAPSEHTLKVAATSVPHAEILEQIKSDLQEKGINLEIIIVDDYNTPNRALADGEIDANYFQHLPFLQQQVKEFDYPIESFVKVHLEPMGLYSKKIDRLSDLPKEAVVAIPNDPTNEARALLLLESKGLITLNRHDVKVTLFNISKNPRHLMIEEVDAPMLTRILEDVDLAAITTNFALQGGLEPLRNALGLENSQSPFVNIVAIRIGEGDRKDLEALKEALTSDKTRAYIEKHYNGAIIPAF